MRYLYGKPTKTYEDLVEKVIQINGEKSGRQSVVSKSGIIDREPQTSNIFSQETPNPVQELVKVLMAALQMDKKKAPQGKGKLLNKQAGAGSAQLAPNPGNTQVKSRVDRATARCNTCTGIGNFCLGMPNRQVFKLNKGGRSGHPPKPRPAGPKPECSPICAQDAGSRPACPSTGAGGSATVETHRSPEGVKG